MPRSLIDDWRSGQLLTRTVTRGKCRYDRHESVRLVDGEWWGESSRGPECHLAPPDVCPVCAGRGQIEVELSAAEVAQYDGPTTAQQAKFRPCPTCHASGFVPGPHWPYRWPQPPPLRMT